MNYLIDKHAPLEKLMNKQIKQLTKPWIQVVFINLFKLEINYINYL